MPVRKKTTEKPPKPKIKKGNSKIQSEKDTEENPLLKIEQTRSEFIIESGNYLNDPYLIIYKDFENFDPMADPPLDADRTDECSDVKVILIYYEYVIVASFKIRHILPVWIEGNRTSDMSFLDIIKAIEHRLTMELQMRVPSFDDINTLDIKFLYKIRYVSPDMIKSRKKLE